MTCARCGQESRARPEEALAAAVARSEDSEGFMALPARSMTAPSLKVVTLRPSEWQVRKGQLVAGLIFFFILMVVGMLLFRQFRMSLGAP